MNQTKYRFERFAFYDFSAIQTHLEEMAAQGWMVEKPGNCFWRYRRMKSKKLHFAVTYFPNASELDPKPTDGQQQMEEYSTKQGWLLAARWGQMQIFYNEADDPIPMETDAVTQVETIQRSMKRNMFPTHFIMAVLCVYQLAFMGFQLFSDPVGFLSKPTSLYMVFAWILILLPVIMEISFYFYWYRKARSLAESGTFLEVRTHRVLSLVLFAVSILFIGVAVLTSASGLWASLGWCLIMIILGFFLRFFRDRLKSHGVSRTVNRVVLITAAVILSFTTMGGLVYSIMHYDLFKERQAVGTYNFNGWVIDVYDDELPLQVEDIMTVPAIEWSRQAQRSATFLVSSTEYTQYPLSEDRTIPDLNYTVTEIKSTALYGFCKNRLLKAKRDEKFDDGTVFTDHYEQVDAAPWGAMDAYQLHWSDSILNNYLLFYEDQIVEIQFGWEPTPEQMVIVAEKLAKF